MLTPITHESKILLITCPFLTPLCPPSGIASLKSYLKAHGYTNVKTMDLTGELPLRELCYQYFEKLRTFIPKTKQGHFFNIGLDVLEKHFLASQRYTDEAMYTKLIKILVAENFFCEIDDLMANELDSIVQQFFLVYTEQVTELLTTEAPIVLGVQVTKGNLAAAMKALELGKKLNPKLLTIMGGPIFAQELFINTPNYQRFLNATSYIDKIVIGEGEQLLLKLLQNELTSEQKVYTLEDINDELLDLNTLNYPDYEDFDLNQYPILPASTSRGCVSQCKFCAETVYWKRYRKKDVAKIADELSYLAELYNRRVFVFTDCLINPVATDLARELISRNLNLYWDVYLRVSSQVCDPEFTALWRRGGFYRARLGIESGSERVLKLMNKGITVEQSKTALISMARVGIKTSTYWVAGYPGETEEDFQKTLDFLTEMQDYIFEAECDPLRYYPTGQVASGDWGRELGDSLLYPEEMTEMLLVQNWRLHSDPSREIAYERQCRFREHCQKLGILNPYSVSEIYQADKRWQKLQPNAVPMLFDIQNGQFTDPCRTNPKIFAGEVCSDDEVDFAF